METGHGRDVSGNRTNLRGEASTLRWDPPRGLACSRVPPSTTQGLGSHCARKPPRRVALSYLESATTLEGSTHCYLVGPLEVPTHGEAASQSSHTHAVS
jgi:hypothetical protein